MLRALTLPGAEYLMPFLFPPLARDAGDAVSGFVARQGWSAPHVAEMWDAYASLTGVENRHAFVRTLRAVIDIGGQSVSAEDRLYLTSALPTLIVWGDEDPIIPVEHAYAAHEAMPGSRLEIFEGVGHFPHMERPERFVEVLLDFLDTNPPLAEEVGSYAELLRLHGSD
jgi:pimeloyl-ACP methyl ester carboxylesterase